MSGYTVYGMSSSGNCYKVRLLLEQLATPYRWIEIDTRSGGTRSSEFLAKNPNGRVPLLRACARTVPGRIGCDPVLPGRGHGVLAG